MHTETTLALDLLDRQLAKLLLVARRDVRVDHRWLLIGSLLGWHRKPPFGAPTISLRARITHGATPVIGSSEQPKADWYPFRPSASPASRNTASGALGSRDPQAGGTLCRSPSHVRPADPGTMQASSAAANVSPARSAATSSEPTRRARNATTSATCRRWNAAKAGPSPVGLLGRPQRAGPAENAVCLCSTPRPRQRRFRRLYGHWPAFWPQGQFAHDDTTLITSCWPLRSRNCIRSGRCRY